MDYRHYTSNDFALDKRFQQWVLHPDEESNRFWNKWIFEHPDKQEEVAGAIEIIRLTGLSGNQEANADFLSIWKGIMAETQTQETIKVPPKSITPRYFSLAAALTGILVLFTFLWYIIQVSEPVVYATEYGEIREVELPDGSKVTLNANSSLELLGEWDKTSARKTFLEGEAFFEIVKTPDHREFIVNTPDDIAVKVLGTEFNVNTRRQQTDVFLQSGKVKVDYKFSEVTLQPGELAEYDHGEKKVNVKTVRSENKVAWKDNFFVFDDTPLYRIAWELEDNFGTKVTIASDSLARLKFTARVPREQDLLLDVLSETMHIEIVKRDNEILMQL